MLSLIGALGTLLFIFQVPSNATVDYSKTGLDSFPVIKVENVYVLPGVPELLKASFLALKADLQDGGSHKTIVRECFIISSEFAITDRLNALVDKYKGSVTFGSYPQWTHNYYETKLTVESANKSTIEQVVQEIHECMDVIEYDKDPIQDASEKIANLLMAKSEVNSGQAKRQDDLMIRFIFRTLSLLRPSESHWKS